MEKSIKLIVSGVVVVVLAVVSGFWFFEKIDNGNVGIEYSLNGGVRQQALSQGVHFVGLDKVTQYPVKTQTIKQHVALATGDGKKTDVVITYSYHVDPTRATSVYKKFGNVEIKDIEKGWLNQQLLASGRSTLSKYTLLEVVGTDSTKVQSGLLKDFQKRAEAQGFIIEDLSFGTPSLDNQTQKSIDDIIKAGQDNKKAELEAKTKMTKANADAEAKVTRAKADAKANQLISDSITDKVIANKEADARLKHGWVTVEGASAVVK